MRSAAERRRAASPGSVAQTSAASQMRPPVKAGASSFAALLRFEARREADRDALISSDQIHRVETGSIALIALATIGTSISGTIKSIKCVIGSRVL